MHCQLLYAAYNTRQMTVFDCANYTAIFPVLRKISEWPANQSLHVRRWRWGDRGCQPTKVLFWDWDRRRRMWRVTGQGRGIWKLPASRGDVLLPVNWKYALGEWVTTWRRRGKCSAHAPPLVADHHCPFTGGERASEGDTTSDLSAEVSVWRRSDSLLGLETSQASSVLLAGRPLFADRIDGFSAV